VAKWRDSSEAQAVSRRKQICEALHPKTKRGGNAQGPCRQFGQTAKEKFTEATAAATGKAERNIHRAAARGEPLAEIWKPLLGRKSGPSRLRRAEVTKGGSPSI
jgi:hypothetical protein